MEKAERSNGNGRLLGRRALRGFLGAVLFCSASAPSAEEAAPSSKDPAGIDKYPAISAEQVKSGQFRPGEKRSITGKYHELVNRELRLFDVDAKFVLSEPQMSSQLLAYKAQKTNLTVLGSFRDPAKDGGTEPSGSPVFDVEKIVLAPGDGELYERKLRDLLESPRRSAEDLKKLTLEAAFMLKRFRDPDLLPVVRRMVAAAYQRAEASLAASDADGRLELIRQLHEAMDNVELVLDLLRAQARRYPQHRPTQAFLRKLHCHNFEGKWLTYDEFKQELGFVFEGGRWIKPERKEFLETVRRIRAENQINLILRSRTDREYAVLAQEGKVENGMTREELSGALGLPDRVLRETDDGREVDQWNYGDKRVYLLNGLVVGKAP